MGYHDVRGSSTTWRLLSPHFSQVDSRKGSVHRRGMPVSYPLRASSHHRARGYICQIDPVLPTRQTGGRRGRCHSRSDGSAAACRVKAGVLSCDLQTKPRQSRCLSSTMHLPQVPKTESGARTDRLTSCDTKCCSRIRLLHLETVPSAPTPVRQRPAEPAGGRQAGEMNTCRRASRFDPCLSRTSLPGR